MDLLFIILIACLLVLKFHSVISSEGNTWVASSAPTAYWTAISSCSNGSVLVALDEGIDGGGGYAWISKNQGSTWSQTDSPQTNWVLIAGSSTGQNMLAAENNGILFYSTDYGNKWTAVSSSPQIMWSSIACEGGGSNCIAVALNAGSTLYYFDFGQLTLSFYSVSYLNVNAWAAITIGCCYQDSSWSVAYVAAGDTSNSYSGRIYYSNNIGASDTYVELSGSPTLEWTAITCNSDGTTVVAAANNNGIYYSLNSGETWTMSDAPSNNNWFRLATSLNGQYLAALEGCVGTSCTTNQIYLSADLGKTWILSNANEKPYSALASNGSGSLIAATIYDSTIELGTLIVGPSAEPTNPPTASPTSPTQTPTAAPTATTNYWVPLTTVPPNVDWTAIFSSSNGNLLIGTSIPGDIWVSSNFGETWQAVSQLQNGWRIAGSATGDLLIAAVWEGTLYSSTNQGYSWSNIYGVPSNGMWMSVACSSSTGQYCLAAGYGNQLFYASANYGQDFSWSQQDVPLGMNWTSVAITANGEVGYAAPEYGPLYSFFAGWYTSGNSPSMFWTAIACDTTGTYVVATTRGSGIWYTLNAGSTWYLSNAPDVSTVHWIALTISLDGENLAATCNNTADGNEGSGIYLSNRFGATWQVSTVKGESLYNTIGSNGNGTRLVAVSGGNHSMLIGTIQISTLAPTLSPSQKPSLHPTQRPSLFPTYSQHPTFTPSYSMRPTISPTMPRGDMYYVPNTCAPGETYGGGNVFSSGACFYFTSYNQYGEKGDTYNGIITCSCPGNSASHWEFQYFYSTNYNCDGDPMYVYSGTGTNCIETQSGYYITVDCQYPSTNPPAVCNDDDSSGGSTTNSTAIIAGVIAGAVVGIGLLIAALYYFGILSVGGGLLSYFQNTSSENRTISVNKEAIEIKSTTSPPLSTVDTLNPILTGNNPIAAKDSDIKVDEEV